MADEVPGSADVSRLRRLVADPNGETWDDGQIIAALQDNVWQDGVAAPLGSVGFFDPIVTGWDAYGAAADLLDAEVLSLRRKFDMTDAGGAQMKLNQLMQNAAAAADRMRQRARPRTTTMGRSDVWPALRHASVTDYPLTSTDLGPY